MSWLQNTFRGLLFKNVAFNLTIQDKKKHSRKGVSAFIHPAVFLANSDVENLENRDKKANLLMTTGEVKERSVKTGLPVQA